MRRFLSPFVSLLLLAGCGPNRVTFDSAVEDVQSRTDANNAESSADGAMDGSTDATLTEASADGRSDAAEASGPCLAASCDDMCTDAGAIVGRCVADTSGNRTCVCTGLPDARADGTTGDGRTDGAAPDRPDVVYESSIMGCMSNSECPPSMYCNATMCSGVGFCSLRGETDPTACGTSGPASCGCDGVLYPNSCVRQSAGVRQDPARACSVPDASVADARVADASGG